MIMAIPAPVVLPAKTTMVRKISLVLLFSGGFFVMIASILRVTYVMVVSLSTSLAGYVRGPWLTCRSHTQQQDGSTAAIWSCREDFVAIVVGQVPMGTYKPYAFWTAGIYETSAEHLKDRLDIRETISRDWWNQ